MKNTKLSVGLIACLLSVGGLAGCSTVQASNDGVLLSYSIDGVPQDPIKADDILEKAYDDSSKYQSIFDIIYSVLVKNYFTKDYNVNYYGHPTLLGKEQLGNPSDKPLADGKIYARANLNVKNDKATAETNAKANDTTYKKEFDAILESKGVSDEEELRDKYVEELEKEVFEKNFYTYYIEDLKLGAGATTLVGQSADTSLANFWPGYFKDQMPYHVSHILVKLEDDSETKYADGTISSKNAERLATLVSVLESGKQDFQEVASNYSDDTTSRALSGDLGIMDASTTFVNEFKLGIYAYENIFGDAKAGDEIGMSDKIKGNYTKAVSESFDSPIPTISKEIFAELGKVAKIEKDKANEDVLKGSANFFPRNVIYNKYLNRHSFAFVETTDAGDLHAATATTGYHQYTQGALAGKMLLSAKVSGQWRPILAVRAGTSEYHGIHFIVVNRSPYDLNLNGVSQTNYYTTFYPDQEKDYPKDKDGNPIQSYINFSSANSDISATRKRAEELTSKLKSFDSDRLSKYIFRKYLNEENVQIKQEKMKNSLLNWIETSVLKAEDERGENWSKTWTEYIDTLSRQGAERSKLVPQACRLVYLKGNSDNNVETLVSSAELKLSSGDIAQIKADIKAFLPQKDGETELDWQTRLDGYYNKAVSEWFKAKGGLCNDNEAHF